MLRFIGAHSRAFWFAVVGFACALASFPAAPLLSRAAAQAPITNPKDGEVPLPAKGGWHARLVYETPDKGIWTVRSHQIHERYGSPELIALDDAGRCTILVSYSGKWTPWQTVHDGLWLGAVARVAFDPSFAEPQLYAGGQRGRLYQIVPRARGGFDTRVAVDVAGEEIHTIVGGDLVPARDGRELLLFTRSGVVVDVRREGRGFVAKEIHRLPGRVRGALVLPHEDGDTPWIVTVSRARQVALVRHDGDGLTSHVIHEAEMGFGRITRHPTNPRVVYVTRDDGVLVRLERPEGAAPDARWNAETIYAGPQGLRGVVAGRFVEDANVESVAVFGYGRRVQLLTRRPNAKRWHAETIFTDRAPGHDLIAAELDGRNGTLEIVGSGYGGRVFMLTRPPGYGLDVATDPEPPVEPKSARSARPAGSMLRIPVAASVTPVSKLNTIEYGGGFETKSFVYEPLVRRDAEGRLAPGLAKAWRYEDHGRALVLELVEGRRFHDGTPVDAEAVCAHFRRWIGVPKHAWLGATRRIKRAKAVGATTVRLEMDRPHDILPELAATNPCGIVAPGAFGPDGAFGKPLGTGPFAFTGASDDNREFRYARVGGNGGIRLTRYGHPLSIDPVAALKRGDIDLIVDAWLTRIPRASIAALREDPAVRLTSSPGSAVRFIGFHLARCPLALRARIAAFLDRKPLIDAAEGGYGEPCLTWMAPSVRVWPEASPVEPVPVSLVASKLRVLADAKFPEDQVLARAIAAQLSGRGIPAVAVTPDRRTYASIVQSGEYELRIDRTWGVPYDPFITLACRYGPADPAASSRAPAREIPEGLSQVVGELMVAQTPEKRAACYLAIQRMIDRDFAVLPLYTTPRFAAVRRGAATIDMDHDLYRYAIRFGE